MKRLPGFLYGLLCYAVFGISFAYAVLFLAGAVVPTTINSGPNGDPWVSALIDLALLGTFALQHSVMARPVFKSWWTHFASTSIERSTYVLLASLLLLAIFVFWRPLPQTIWNVDLPLGRALVTALFALGWLIVVVSTFAIDHFDLLGLRQVWLALKGRPYTPLAFTRRFPYGVVRHPLMFGFLVAFWATPTMSAGHLLFALAMTAYILVGIVLEERDLVRFLGEDYERYRREVPMVVPLTKLRAPSVGPLSREAPDD